MQLTSQKQTYTIVEEFTETIDKIRHFRAYSEIDDKIRYIVSIPSAISSDLYVKLEEIQKKGHFDDLTEYFFANDCLNLVFTNPNEHTLAEILERENLSIAERWEILKKILEKILLLDAPPFFIKSVLKTENIHISPTFAISFSYDCCDILKTDDIKVKDVAEAFLAVCHMVFDTELEINSMPELKDFCNAVNEQMIENYMQLYQLFYPVYYKCHNITEQQLKPDGLQVKIHKKILWLRSKKRVIIGTVILVLAISYLGLTVYKRLAPDKAENYFEQIGERTFLSHDTE